VFVDVAVLRSGGAASGRAGDHAQEAAQHLSRAALEPGIFGDFAAAETFHEAVGSMQAHHMALLRQHRTVLVAVGGRACRAAAGFTEMDASNAASVQAVWCDSAT